VFQGGWDDSMPHRRAISSARIAALERGVMTSGQVRPAAATG